MIFEGTQSTNEEEVVLKQVKSVTLMLILLVSDGALGASTCLSVLTGQKLGLFDRPTSYERHLEEERVKLVSDEEASLIKPEEFVGVRQATDQILKIAGSDPEAIFVGIGRSPAPITALMKAMDMPNVYNLPLSAFRARSGLSRWRAIVGEIFLDSSYASKFSEEEERVLFEHFERFLPTNGEELKSKTIYVIDLIITGTGLVAATDYIQKFYKSLDLDVKVSPIAIKLEGFGPEFFVPELFFVDSVTYDRKDEAFGERLHRQGYDLYSPYGQFSPRMDRWVPQANPLYKRLIEELKTYLNNQ